MGDVLEKFDTLYYFIRTIAEGFKPDADVYIKKSEGKTLMQIKMNEGKSMKYYSKKADMENGSFTYLADKLEKKGCIKRVAHPTDRRIKVLYLTEEGHRISKVVDDQFERHVESKLAILDEEDIAKLDIIFQEISVINEKLRKAKDNKKKTGE